MKSLGLVQIFSIALMVCAGVGVQLGVKANVLPETHITGSHFADDAQFTAGAPLGDRDDGRTNLGRAFAPFSAATADPLTAGDSAAQRLFPASSAYPSTH